MMFELGIARDTIGAIVGHGAEDGRGSRTLIRHYLKCDIITRKTHALEAWDAHLRPFSPTSRRRMSYCSTVRKAHVDNSIRLVRLRLSITREA